MPTIQRPPREVDRNTVRAVVCLTARLSPGREPERIVGFGGRHNLEQIQTLNAAHCSGSKGLPGYQTPVTSDGAFESRLSASIR